MEKNINVFEFIKNGLTENNGFILRQKIEEVLKDLKENDVIILNFEKIFLFATPFFNTSIGFFVLTLGPEQFDKIFRIIKISDLGMNTYQHSYENAVENYNKKLNIEVVGEITKANIEKS